MMKKSIVRPETSQLGVSLICFRSIHHPASLVRFMKSKFRSGTQLYTEDI